MAEGCGHACLAVEVGRALLGGLLKARPGSARRPCRLACSVYLTPHIAGVTEMSCEPMLPLHGGPLHGAAAMHPALPTHATSHHAPCAGPPASSSCVHSHADRNMARIVADAVVALKRGEPPARLLNAPERPRGAAAAAAAAAAASGGTT